MKKIILNHDTEDALGDYIAQCSNVISFDEFDEVVEEHESHQIHQSKR